MNVIKPWRDPKERKVTLPKLRWYQREAGRAIFESVSGGHGRTITVQIARQGGKNELSAQLELFLMLRAAAHGGEAVKTAPTFRPQLRISMRRLSMRMRESGMRRLARQEGDAISIGRARIAFLSADAAASVVGHTASLLLEVDEAQDVDAEKFDREFRPMAATSNATTVLYGTPWDDTSLLERAKQANLALERRDGVRRHFEYDWQVIARENAKYLAFVERERARLGETHPTFLTQYCLKTISGGGRMLTAAQRAQMIGWHGRLSAPVAGEEYVAGLDLAGGDLTPAFGHPSPSGGEGLGTNDIARDERSEAAESRNRSRRDATVLTIGRLVYPMAGAMVQEPRVEIVEQYAWTGEPHELLIPRLIDLLRDVWRAHRVAVDATGLGETAARLLAQTLGSSRVEAIKFTQDTKSKLGFGLIAAVNGGRLKTYRGDGSAESAEFQRQCELARAEYRANSTMRFFVNPAEGHDDYLVSAALLVQASQGRTRRVASGRVRV